MAEDPVLKGFLSKHPGLCLDTSIFIHFVEKDARYHGLCAPIFEAIEKGHVRAATSTLSLLEILVQPYREKLDDLVLKFYALLTTYPNIRWIELSKEIADSAARIRAEYRLKTPDAIQVATALSSGATGFVCNDPVFKRVREFECLLLEDCLQRRGR